MAPEKSPRFSTVPIFSLLLINSAMLTALPSTRFPHDHSTAVVTKTSTPQMPSDRGYVTNCPWRQYFSPEVNSCQPCSSCPINQIIRTPCSAFADTLCGPFVEFDTFNQSPAETMPEELEKGSGRDHVQEPSKEDSIQHELEPKPQQRVSVPEDQKETIILLTLATVFCVTLLTAFMLIYYVGCQRMRHQPSPSFLHYLQACEQEEIYGLYPEPRLVEKPDSSSQGDGSSSCHQSAHKNKVKGCDMSKLLPLMPSHCCDTEIDMPVASTEQNDSEHLYVYINPQNLETCDSQ